MRMIDGGVGSGFVVTSGITSLLSLFLLTEAQEAAFRRE